MEQTVETVTVREPRGAFTAQTGVECKLPVPSSGVHRVLSAVGRPVAARAECAESEVKYQGKVLFSVIYLDGEGRVSKSECGVEFSGEAPCPCSTPNAGVETDASVQGVRFRVAGDTLYLTAAVSLSFRVAENTQHAVVVGAQNAHTRTEEKKCPWKIKEVAGEIELEEYWEEPSAPADILTFTASATVKSAQAGVGVIAAEGSVTFHLIVKPVEGGVYAVNKTFPFRVETEEEAANPASAVRLSAEVGDVRFEVISDPDNGVGKITAYYTLSFRGALYGEQTVTLLSDCFSEGEELSLTTESAPYETLLSAKTESARVTARAPLKAPVGEGARAVATLPYGAVCSMAEAQAGGVKAEGVLSLSLFYVEEGTLKATDADIPFSLSLKCQEMKDCASPEVRFAVESLQADFIGEGEVSVTAHLAVTLTATKENCLCFVKEIAVGERKPPKSCGVTVYFPKVGEDEWELSKRLSVSPDLLAECNPDLTYPLSGRERIVIYRQKQRD